MGNMCSETNKELFQFLLLEQVCASRRIECNKDCRSCKFYTDSQLSGKLYNQLIGIVKSRSPELYFSDNLSTLHKILEEKQR